jgi:TonB family protein
MRITPLLLGALVSMAIAMPQSPVGRWPGGRPMVFVDLAYPPEALDARTAGVVVVRVTTDADGRVIDAERLSGSERLVPAVLANVRQWTLSPGARTEAVVYRFEIDHALCNDDTRSLFRLVRPNLALITACSRNERGVAYPASDEWQFASAVVAAAYPPIAQSARFEGVIVLELSIDRNGRVVDSRSLTDLPLLAPAAVAHSKTWRFHPTERMRGMLVYEFALDARHCEPRARTEFWRVAANYWRLSGCSPLIDI